jgi:hypothetical protein
MPARPFCKHAAGRLKTLAIFAKLLRKFAKTSVRVTGVVRSVARDSAMVNCRISCHRKAYNFYIDKRLGSGNARCVRCDLKSTSDLSWASSFARQSDNPHNKSHCEQAKTSHLIIDTEKPCISLRSCAKSRQSEEAKLFCRRATARAVETARNNYGNNRICHESNNETGVIGHVHVSALTIDDSGRGCSKCPWPNSNSGNLSGRPGRS